MLEATIHRRTGTYPYKVTLGLSKSFSLDG